MLLRAPAAGIRSHIRSSIRHKCVRRVMTRSSPRTALQHATQDFSSSHGGHYSLSVLGDLHLEPAQMHLFHEAREQLLAAMSAAEQQNSQARVVQLGDLGGYNHKPGQPRLYFMQQ
eukprot:GHUV01040868.1.p1 GENE.GHUV01040868.1~~GHUV01040868.1.p1  ORF type:complete len:116 (+),score=24.91 GHUV01040868.1:244-591(+)